MIAVFHKQMIRYLKVRKLKAEVSDHLNKGIYQEMKRKASGWETGPKEPIRYVDIQSDVDPLRLEGTTDDNQRETGVIESLDLIRKNDGPKRLKHQMERLDDQEEQDRQSTTSSNEEYYDCEDLYNERESSIDMQQRPSYITILTQNLMIDIQVSSSLGTSSYRDDKFLVIRWATKSWMLMVRPSSMMTLASVVRCVFGIVPPRGKLPYIKEGEPVYGKPDPDQACQIWPNDSRMRPGSRFDASHYYCVNCHWLSVAEEAMCFRCKRNPQREKCVCISNEQYFVKRKQSDVNTRRVYRGTQIRVLDKSYIGGYRVDELTSGASRNN